MDNHYWHCDVSGRHVSNVWNSGHIIYDLEKKISKIKYLIFLAIYMCEITITTTYEKDHVANKITELPHSIIDCKLTWNNDIFGRPKQSFALTSAELEARLISIGANSVWISVIGGNMAIDGNYPYLVLFIKLGKDNVDNPFDQSTADKLAVRLTEADGQILQKAEEMMAEKEMMAEVEMMAEKEMMAEEA